MTEIKTVGDLQQRIKDIDPEAPLYFWDGGHKEPLLFWYLHNDVDEETADRYFTMCFTNNATQLEKCND